MIFLLHAGRVATLGAQKEEKEIMKENELYEVPTSCDTQKEGVSIEMKENNLYDVPIPVILMTEYDTQNKPINIETKENVSYHVPTPMNMTECQAYGSLPNKP